MIRERPPQKEWSESDLDTCTISWTFSREGWKLPDSLRAQLKFDPFMASNRHEMGSTNSRDEKQAKFVPTAECYGLDALETVKNSTELPEDLWSNLSAMVTRLQQLCVGSHEENCLRVNMASIAISELVLRVTVHRSCIAST